MFLKKIDKFVFGDELLQFFLFGFFVDSVFFFFSSLFSFTFFYFFSVIYSSYTFTKFSFFSKVMLRNFFLIVRLGFIGFKFFFFNEFFLDGLYYRVKYYKNFHSLGFLVGYSHYIVYQLPRSVFVRLHMKRRRFLLFSVDKILLNIVSLLLIKLKYPNVYIGKGIKLTRGLYKRKKIIKKR